MGGGDGCCDDERELPADGGGGRWAPVSLDELRRADLVALLGILNDDVRLPLRLSARHGQRHHTSSPASATVTLG